MRKTAISGTAIGFTLVAFFLLHQGNITEELQHPENLHQVDYVQAQGCRRCHEQHYESWSETFHRRMTQEANEDSVIGAFDGRSIDYFGWTLRFHKDSGAFLATAQSPDGQTRRYEVRRTVGSHRYQQYLGEDRDQPGTFLRLPFAWDPAQQQFVHMNGAFLTPDPAFPAPLEDFERHITRWNDNCVFCHNVAPNPGLETMESGPRFDTEIAELGIACEACHGPGEEHASRNSDPFRRYRLHGTNEADPTIVNPERLSANLSADICGRCHGQRLTGDIAALLEDGDPFLPGEDLARYSEPLWQDTTLNGAEDVFANRFWSDGSPRLTAYEYQGWLQSPCSQAPENGSTCTTCHAMHGSDPDLQLRDGHRGSQSCIGCHAEQGDAPQRHHFHEAELGCVDCHTPATVYGLVSIHRTHRVSSPSPRDTMGDGSAPSACLLCHGNRSVPWAQTQVAQLWPETGAIPQRPGEDSAPMFPALEALLLGGDPIERAVAAHAFQTAQTTSERHRWHLLLDTMVHDPYPAVRRIAERSFRAAMGASELAGIDYDPLEPQDERQRRLEGAYQQLDLPTELPGAAPLRAEAAQHTIFIGE